MDKNSIEELLLKWDKKHTDFLKKFYGENIINTSFVDDLMQIFLANPQLEHATSWLLKHHVDQGHIIGQEKINQLLQRIGKLTYWGSQLHLLQIIPKLALTAKQATAIEPALRNLLLSENKFVRAASFEAYFEIVKLFPDLQREFILTCNEALVRESAAVKVKIKRILKELPPQ